MHVSGRGKGITVLDLGSVFVSSDDEDSLSLIKSLDLSFNKLSVVQQGSIRIYLTSLTSLDLSHNQISNIETGALPLNLERLFLQHNRLSNIADAIWELHELEELNVSNNIISSLSSCFGGPKQGKNKKGTHIGDIRLTTTIPQHPRLQIFRADHNRLVSIGGLSVIGGPLKVLSLNNNYINNIGDVKKGLGIYSDSLEVLSLAQCPVMEVNDYRAEILSVCCMLSSLDGVPVVWDNNNNNNNNCSGNADKGRSIDRHDQDNNRRVLGTSKSILMNAPPPDLSVDITVKQGRRETGEMRNPVTTGRQGAGIPSTSVPKKVSPLPLNAHEIMLVLQEEQRESAMIRRENEELKKQLSEARHIISDQLNTISFSGSEREAAIADANLLRRRCMKLAKENEYLRSKIEADKRHMTEEIERLRVRNIYEESLNIVRSRASSNGRSQCHDMASLSLGTDRPIPQNTTSSAPKRRSINKKNPNRCSIDVSVSSKGISTNDRHNNGASVKSSVNLLNSEDNTNTPKGQHNIIPIIVRRDDVSEKKQSDFKEEMRINTSADILALQLKDWMLQEMRNGASKQKTSNKNTQNKRVKTAR